MFLQQQHIALSLVPYDMRRLKLEKILGRWEYQVRWAQRRCRLLW